MNRLKHILAPISHYGIGIENQNILAYTVLHSPSINAYKLNNTSKDTRIMYVMLTLDIFYDKRNTIDETVNNIHNGIINVLNHNFSNF